MLKLKEQAPDDVLYTEHLPRLLTRHCKINGQRPIRQLKILSFNGDSYALLDPLPTDKNHAEIFAVKIGDEVHRGYVLKHVLQLNQVNNKNWNISQAEVVPTLCQNTDVVQLHPSYHKKDLHTINLPINKFHNKKQISLTNFTSSLLNAEKYLPFIIRLNDKFDTQDNTIRIENDLYNFFIF